MGMPTDMAVFDAMYAMAAADGRGEALFGSSFEAARDAYERMLIGSGRRAACLEFPLVGTPCADILTAHSAFTPQDRFAPGAGFGYQHAFSWFARERERERAGECDGLAGASLFLEADTSRGPADQAGLYLQHRDHVQLIDPFLALFAAQHWEALHREQRKRMPNGWQLSYVGLFEHRGMHALRIGGYLGLDAHRACARNPRALASAFDGIGFTAYDGEMLALCSRLLSFAPTADFQFDILPNGLLSSVFGLSLSFNEVQPRRAHACMNEGCGRQIMDLLESQRLADDRWRLLADATFAKRVPFTHKDGSAGQYALCSRFNYAKVKFADAAPLPAKFYLQFIAGEVR